MSPTRIKICGITQPDDARAAADAGADAIGLVFYAGSPRAVEPEQAARIVAALPPLVSAVALFVDASADRVSAVLAQVPVDVLQFHGSESPDFCAQFARPYLKALRMEPGRDIAALATGYGSARGLLLDSFRPGVPGGTGESFDWSQAPVLALPLILAGGLSPDNVADAIHQLRPAAVDVSGGVESAPGRKDPELMRAFCNAVRATDKQLNGG